MVKFVKSRRKQSAHKPEGSNVAQIVRRERKLGSRSRFTIYLFVEGVEGGREATTALATGLAGHRRGPGRLEFSRTPVQRSRHAPAHADTFNAVPLRFMI
ncbi:hypothetical protein ABEB36_003114 [Hypothenemus hampei]|uniref:Uncharacterized protein n=1 Tax=Hypothenemus hampei TaxID=57062 RepID=A0ABD1F824_HYPHA